MTTRRDFLRMAGAMPLATVSETSPLRSTATERSAGASMRLSQSDIRYLGRPTDFWVHRLIHGPHPGRVDELWPPPVRYEVMRALSAVGESAISGILGALDCERATVHREAIRSLCEMDSEAAGAALECTLHHPNPLIRDIAIREVARTPDELRGARRKKRGPFDCDLAYPKRRQFRLSFLLRALANDETVARQRAIWELALWDYLTVRTTVKALGNCLHDSDPRISVKTAAALHLLRIDFGTDPKPILANAMFHKNGGVREIAAAGVGESSCGLRPFDESEVVPRLLELLRDDKQAVRLAALRSLASRQKMKTVRAALLDVMRRDPDATVKAEAIFTLGQHDVMSDRSIVTILRNALTNENGLVRSKAVYSIMSFIPRKEVVPLLAKALDDTDDRVRHSAGYVLACKDIDPGTLLGKASKHSDPSVRRWATWRLNERSQNTPYAVACLKRMLGDSDGHVRRSALAGLLRVWPSNGSAIYQLKGMLDDSEPNHREWAAVKLSHLGHAEFEYLLAAARYRNPRVRAAAMHGLAGYAQSQPGGHDPRIAAALTRGSEDEDLAVRVAAAPAVSANRS